MPQTTVTNASNPLLPVCLQKYLDEPTSKKAPNLITLAALLLIQLGVLDENLTEEPESTLTQQSAICHLIAFVSPSNEIHALAAMRKNAIILDIICAAAVHGDFNDRGKNQCIKLLTSYDHLFRTLDYTHKKMRRVQKNTNKNKKEAEKLDKKIQDLANQVERLSAAFDTNFREKTSFNPSFFAPKQKADAQKKLSVANTVVEELIHDKTHTINHTARETRSKIQKMGFLADELNQKLKRLLPLIQIKNDALEEQTNSTLIKKITPSIS